MEQDSFCIFMKCMEISSKSDTLPFISQSWTLNKLRLNSWAPWVSGSCQTKNIIFLTIHCLFDRNAAWTVFLTKYSAFDLEARRSRGNNSCDCGKERKCKFIYIITWLFPSPGGEGGPFIWYFGSKEFGIQICWYVSSTLSPGEAGVTITEPVWYRLVWTLDPTWECSASGLTCPL